MEFTIISVLVFASIIMCLVLLLNLAEKKLTLFFNDQGILDSWNLEESVD